MNDIYQQAYSLLNDPVTCTEGLALLHQNVLSRPQDMKALFEYASALDFLDRENDAAQAYQTILQQGYSLLPADDQPRLFVQLGSTLRLLKKLDESRACLRQGIDLFPDYLALHAFLSLTEYAEKPDDEIRYTLLSFIKTARDDLSLTYYSRALNYYTQHLSDLALH